jgi:cathepsin D
MDELHADGLLGLAFPSISKFIAYPLFESLLRQKKLINPTFSFKLSSSGAEMFVGGTNGMLYNGDITYTRITYPASQNGRWGVDVADVEIM